MKVLTGIFLVSFGLALSACKAVYSTMPVGENPALLEAEDWEGIWMHRDGFLCIKVIEPENGRLQIGWIDKEQTFMELETYDVYVLESGGELFLNIGVEKEDTEETLYLWGKVIKNYAQVIGWEPEVEAFKTLVEEGQLPGNLEDGNVYLDSLQPEHYELLRSEASTIFQMEQPAALIRIAE